LTINPIVKRLCVKKSKNTEGVILPLFFDMKHQISSKFAFLMTKTTCNDI
jgi:hypothetical protein